MTICIICQLFNRAAFLGNLTCEEYAMCNQNPGRTRSIGRIIRLSGKCTVCTVHKIFRSKMKFNEIDVLRTGFEATLRPDSYFCMSFSTKSKNSVGVCACVCSFGC